MMFRRGDFVWGKMKSYPWWPAMVLNAEDCGRKKNEDRLWLFWFGDHRFSEVSTGQVEDFRLQFSRNAAKTAGKLFKRSMEETLLLLASLYGLRFDNDFSLFNWASTELQPDSRRCLRWTKPDLPIVVQKAILERMRKMDSDESEDDFDSDDAIYYVRIGEKTLEDICIGCSKNGVRTCGPHPLFMGSICIYCVKDVEKACIAPVGELQSVCIVCGQGGQLVYCSNPICFRAFCQMCIEYMVSRKEYTQILQNDNWLCYLCEIREEEGCLIKRRPLYNVRLPWIPRLPLFKVPINVLAFSEAGLAVLNRAKIRIGNYRVDPSKEEIMQRRICKYVEGCSNFDDFSREQIEGLNSDMILGSFFSFRKPYERKECTVMFFEKFSKFLYRFNNTKLVKSDVFYFFMADAKFLDENVQDRVLRFLQVKPLTMEFGSQRKLLLWSNISYFLPDGNEKLHTEYGNDQAVEETILNLFMALLQRYFLREH